MLSRQQSRLIQQARLMGGLCRTRSPTSTTQHVVYNTLNSQCYVNIERTQCGEKAIGNGCFFFEIKKIFSKKNFISQRWGVAKSPAQNCKYWAQSNRTAIFLMRKTHLVKQKCTSKFFAHNFFYSAIPIWRKQSTHEDQRVCQSFSSIVCVRKNLLTVEPQQSSISNCMHGDRGNPKIVWLMLALCVLLHVVVIPVWMWSVGLQRVHTKTHIS